MYRQTDPDTALFYKRHIETPRRPLKVWSFDVSKQLIGAVVVHFVNIAMSSEFASPVGSHRVSPCVWYFLNIMVDTTLGVFILWLVLKTVFYMCNTACMEGMQSGDYGSPPRWSFWFKQLVAFVVSLNIMKVLVFALLVAVPELADIGTYLLKWTEGHERLRIFFVMFLTPLVMNIVQYVIIDSIVKGKLPLLFVVNEEHLLTRSQGQANRVRRWQVRKTVLLRPGITERPPNDSFNGVYILVGCMST